MKTSRMFFIFAIFICVVGLVGTFVMDQQSKKEIKKVPCYDQRNNVIDGLICTEEVIIGRETYFDLAIVIITSSLSLFVVGLYFEQEGE